MKDLLANILITTLNFYPDCSRRYHNYDKTIQWQTHIISAVANNYVSGLLSRRRADRILLQFTPA
jgi:hypothetical protein